MTTKLTTKRIDTRAALAPAARPGITMFYTSERQAGKIRDVRTGRQIIIPGRRVAAFRVGEVLKRAVRRQRTKRGRHPHAAA